MANLLPFFPNAAFDHNATRAMGKAFDRACHSLHDIGQPDLVREIIANEIKDLARKNIRDCIIVNSFPKHHKQYV
jgi:hypothetical protein